MTTSSERIELAGTILNQMGGTSKLGAMIGANTFLALDNGVQFSFKGSREFNKCVVTLNESMDLYTFQLWKFNSRTYDMVMKYELEGCYCDMLKPVFERETGLYLSL